MRRLYGIRHLYRLHFEEKLTIVEDVRQGLKG